jgi:hypothetical protein
MAQYFETLQLDARRTTVDVGAAPMNRGQRRRMPHLVPITTLFGWEGIHDFAVEQRLYSTGWALFTFLVNQHRSELARYLELLDGSDGPPKETGSQRALRVWPEAIPSLPLGVVDEELRQWLVGGNHVILHFNVQAQKWPTTEHALGDADVYAMRALLLAAAKREAEAKASLQAALATEPIHVLARLVGVAYFKVAVSPAEGRAAAAAHPDDWRAWYLDAIALARAEGESAEEQAAEARICELIAQNRVVVAPVTACPEDQRRTASP